MNKIEKIKASLQGKGYDLRKIKGCGDDTQLVNIALEKQDALRLLELYYNLGIPVLGGDVFYLKDDGEVDWTYDGWYVERLENESDIQFLKRSIEESQSYISNYNNVFFRNAHFLFDIVCCRFHI